MTRYPCVPRRGKQKQEGKRKESVSPYLELSNFLVQLKLRVQEFGGLVCEFDALEQVGLGNEDGKKGGMEEGREGGRWKSEAQSG